MITLRTVDRKESIDFYKKENLEMTKNSDCLCAKDGDQVLGYCLFDIDDKKITIRAIEPQNDLMLLDGVLRSTLHIAASRNLSEAVWSDNAPGDIFGRLGFINEDNNLNINKLFETDCCGCKKS